jgi:hypothetical protein
MTCYLCRDEAREVGEREGVTYYRCPTCGMLQCEPQAVQYPCLEDKEYLSGGRNCAASYEQYLRMAWKHLRGSVRRCLDFGSGAGGWVEWLRAQGWGAEGFDPYVMGCQGPPCGQFAVVTALEVVEHLGPDTWAALSWMLTEKLAPGGVFYFRTQVWSAEPVDSWWYVQPKAGHVSMWRRETMEYVARRFGLTLADSGGDWGMLTRCS